VLLQIAHNSAISAISRHDRGGDAEARFGIGAPGDRRAHSGRRGGARVKPSGAPRAPPLRAAVAGVRLPP
jgi:hypothetical protein